MVLDIPAAAIQKNLRLADIVWKDVRARDAGSNAVADLALGNRHV